MMNSFSVEMNDSRPITARTGAPSGRMIPQKIWAGVAPSTRADSSSSWGIESKNPLSSQAFTPSAPPRYTSIRPERVLSPTAGNTSETSSMIR